jgi:hypothetical protein
VSPCSLQVKCKVGSSGKMTGGPGTRFNGNELNEPDNLEFPEFLEPDALARLVDDKVPAFTMSYQTSLFASPSVRVTL